MSFADRYRTQSTAQVEFADRIDEQGAFDASLAAYASSVLDLGRGGWEVTDGFRPRTNVLVYYGIGGIGKTTLLAKLEDRARGSKDQPNHWTAAPAYKSPIATCRLDASDFDAEDAMLLLRMAVADLGSPFRAFDMCLARYWWERHSQVDVTDNIRQRGRVRTVVQAVGVAELLQTAVEEMASSLLGTALPGFAAFRGGVQMGDLVLRKYLEKSALRACDGLEDLLAEPAEPTSLPYYAFALAWDLAQIQRKNGARLVIFVDTFEAASASTIDFFNKLAWMLPNALFVVAGRNALQWASSSSELAFAGAQRWPGLVAGSDVEPRQHLVGYLSVEDRTRWLNDVLRGRCSEDVIERAASESHGLPVHLDLIAQHVLDVSRARTVELTDVSGDLDAVAKRVLKDLSDPQRRALLASCLFRNFDVELAQVTADLPNAGPVSQLVSRPYVDRLPRATYEFRLHDLLREVFASATELGDDQWLESDWRRAARRAIMELKRRLEASAHPLEFRDHAEPLFALITTFGCDEDWVVDVAQRLLAKSNWSNTWSVSAIKSFPPHQSWSATLAKGLGVIMVQQTRNRADVVTELEALLAAHPEEARLDVLRYFKGQAQRDSGDVDGSLQTMTRLLDGSMARQAIKGVAHVLRRNGRFAEAEEFIEANARNMQNALRVKAELYWTQGRLSEAAQIFDQCAAGAHRDGDHGERALCVASAAWCNALAGDFATAEEQAREARDVLQVFTQSFAELLVNMTTALIEGLELADTRPLERVADDASRVGQSSVVTYARFAACLVAAVHPAELDVEGIQGALRQTVTRGALEHFVTIAQALSSDEGISEWEPTTIDRWRDIRANLAEVVIRG